MKKFVLATVATALVLSGCAGGMTDTQRNTGIGAGIGALGGAAIGAATGGRTGVNTGLVVGAAAGALGGYLWSQRMENQKRQMEAATQGTGVAVTQTPNNELKLQIPSDVSFDVGRANIKPNFAPVLDQFASGLRNNPNAEVRIIGHTDSTGSDAINNPLSVERATSTRDYLVARGVNAAAFRIEGRGSHEPVADNNSDSGRAQNRRVEIYVGERAPQG
ncbi:MULTISPECIES: OmpA family protein [unclassified Variovorax]|jgi:outer membrane protein OmpA-like peptidoglycan-associated protein|uniref:OmpA family protein n=1 Tax=unclassified Variovorax TaxID=663243 RepID=UPI000F7F8D9D|nr:MULTISPECIES: OmpA family protein [unclassified Variovorax]RSZ38389.1 OmpA family protein [Variovorax sp. 553]RSZ39159.1 OmpA family protein [Variovorax sp. 679]